MKKRSGHVTITDIAERAGVSVTTVSRVVNHRDLVNQETCARVLDAMYQLGYPIPDDANMPMRDLRKRVVVVNTPTPGHAFYNDVFQGITACAARYGWFVMLNEEPICESSYENFKTLLTSCNAVGLITTFAGSPVTLRRLRERIPIIQCCESLSPDIPYIRVNDIQAAKSAIDYLISIGRRKIAIILNSVSPSYDMLDPTTLSYHDRYKGYLSSLKQAGLEFDPEYVIRIPTLHFSYAYNAMNSFLESGHRPDAVFTIVDTLAYAAVVSLQDFGMQVPKDVSVIGFDNIPLAEMCRPKLTTISVPRYDIGYMACEMLHDYCINPDNPPRNMMLNAELIVRGSTQ